MRTVTDDITALYDGEGRRKYLSASERAGFLKAAEKFNTRTAAFCGLLAHTGCRISEALALTAAQLDVGTGRVVFRTLKRRRKSFRAVPVPPSLMADLLRLANAAAIGSPLWPWRRQTGWRRVKAVMRSAGIEGVHATPRGLRHGFGIACAERNVPPELTQRWMGHADLATTGIYQHAVGTEERAFAERLWGSIPPALT